MIKRVLTYFCYLFAFLVFTLLFVRPANATGTLTFPATATGQAGVGTIYKYMAQPAYTSTSKESLCSGYFSGGDYVVPSAYSISHGAPTEGCYQYYGGSGSWGNYHGKATSSNLTCPAGYTSAVNSEVTTNASGVVTGQCNLAAGTCPTGSTGTFPSSCVCDGLSTPDATGQACAAPPVDPCAASSPLIKTFFVTPSDISNTTPGFLIAPETITEACGSMIKISTTDCVLNATQTKCTATYGVAGEIAPDPAAPDNYCYPPDTLVGSVCVPPAPTSATCPAGQVAVGTGTGSYCVTADDPCLIYGNCSQPVDGTGAGTPGTGTGTGGGTGTGAGSPGGESGSGTGATGGTTAASAIDWTDVPSTLGHVPGAVSIPTSTPTFQFTTVAFSTVAGCPAPVSFNVTLPQVGFNRQFEISYQPLCDVATWLRPIFIALAAVAAAMIFAAGLTI